MATAVYRSLFTANDEKKKNFSNKFQKLRNRVAVVVLEESFCFYHNNYLEHLYENQYFVERFTSQYNGFMRYWVTKRVSIFKISKQNH